MGKLADLWSRWLANKITWEVNNLDNWGLSGNWDKSNNNREKRRAEASVKEPDCWNRRPDRLTGAGRRGFSVLSAPFAFAALWAKG